MKKIPIDDRIREIRMHPNGTRVYVSKKSEVTSQIETHVFRCGEYAYRTPLVCGCQSEHNIRQSGAIILGPEGEVRLYVICCKKCAERLEVCDG
jgi:hypothetical protein